MESQGHSSALGVSCKPYVEGIGFMFTFSQLQIAGLVLLTLVTSPWKGSYVKSRPFTFLIVHCCITLFWLIDLCLMFVSKYAFIFGSFYALYLRDHFFPKRREKWDGVLVTPESLFVHHTHTKTPKWFVCFFLNESTILLFVFHAGPIPVWVDSRPS